MPANAEALLALQLLCDLCACEALIEREREEESHMERIRRHQGGPYCTCPYPNRTLCSATRIHTRLPDRFNLGGYYGMSIIKNITFRKVDKCTTQSGMTTDGPAVLSGDTLKYDSTTGIYMTQLRVSGSPRPVPTAYCRDCFVFGFFCIPLGCVRGPGMCGRTWAPWVGQCQMQPEMPGLAGIAV